MNAVILITILLLIVFGLSLYFIYRHYEHLLKKEVKRAQKSERIKSLFIENISHSLRSPMNAIIGYCNMILGEKDENMQPAQVRELVTVLGPDPRDKKLGGHCCGPSFFEGINLGLVACSLGLRQHPGRGTLS